MSVEQTGGMAAKDAKHEIAAYTFLPSATPDRARPGRTISDVMVAMRDGTRLATDVYLPEGEGPFPTILTRMPYGKTEPYCYMPVIAAYWVRKGYAAVVQDVRGKWASEGHFEPNLAANEVPDGYDTVDWIAHQDWSNGSVGMWGESYFGFTSYCAATSGHPALVCVAPGDISLDRYGATFRYGCLQLNTVGTWAISMTDQKYQDLSRLDYWHLPLATMAEAAGAPSRYFDELIANPLPSPFWERHSVLEGYESIRIPVLHWGGWYDNYLGPTIVDWRRMDASNRAAANQHLFIGPWDHEGTADRCHHVGLLPVADGTSAARWDYYTAFFDRYLSGLDNGFGGAGLVRYYVMGADLWRDAPSWPPPETRATPIYLRSGGKANSSAGDGRLAWAPPEADEPADTYVYDPADPVADTLAIDCWAIAGQMGDRRKIERRRDVLVYATPPLEEALELTGPVSAELHFATSAADTDITVALVDVAPDGAANLIQDGILRLSYRNGTKAISHVEPGKVHAVTVDLWSTSYRIAAGHRLHVEVSSSCFNRYDRNLNTGETFGRGTRPVPATQRLLHDAEHPSRIVLPVRPA